MPAVANDHVRNFLERAGIHADAPGSDRFAFVSAAIGGEFNRSAAFKPENLPANRADLLSKRSVLEHLPKFAVNGNEIFRLDELKQDFHFFLAAVAGNVNRRGTAAFVVDQNAAPEKMVNHAVDRFFVTGNDARGKND